MHTKEPVIVGRSRDYRVLRIKTHTKSQSVLSSWKQASKLVVLRYIVDGFGSFWLVQCFSYNQRFTLNTSVNGFIRPFYARIKTLTKSQSVLSSWKQVSKPVILKVYCRWFWVVSAGLFGGYRWFWLVLGSFDWFHVLITMPKFHSKHICQRV